MEILKNTVPTVLFYLPTTDTDITSVSWKKVGDLVETPLTFTVTAEVASARLPYLNKEMDIEVNWTFTIPGSGSGLVHTDTYTVVTPILSTRELEEIVPDASPTEITALESATRHIINSHTGQTFGKHEGIKYVKGSGTAALKLPARLIEVTKFNGVETAFSYFSVEGDGWYLTVNNLGVPPLRADYYGLHQHRGGVIHNPNLVNIGQFLQNYEYQIEGVWGWKEIPSPVKEAAKLLANDYACGDSNYRDRYLTSMTAADWRIQFHSGAFNQTGNVRADQLLSGYVLQRGWAVV